MDNLTTKTDKELEVIIRRAENIDISGSLFQRAKIELKLRDRKQKQKKESSETKRTSIKSLFVKYGGKIIIGVIITVIAVIILSLIF